MLIAVDRRGHAHFFVFTGSDRSLRHVCPDRRWPGLLVRRICRVRLRDVLGLAANSIGPKSGEFKCWNAWERWRRWLSRAEQFYFQQGGRISDSRDNARRAAQHSQCFIL